MYIRAVATKERDNQVKMIIEMLRGGGVEMVLVPDTFAAAQHAVEKGFFTQESLSYILEEKIKDESKPDPIERLV